MLDNDTPIHDADRVLSLIKFIADHGLDTNVGLSIRSYTKGWDYNTQARFICQYLPNCPSNVAIFLRYCHPATIPNGTRRGVKQYKVDDKGVESENAYMGLTIRDLQDGSPESNGTINLLIKNGYTIIGENVYSPTMSLPDGVARGACILHSMPNNTPDRDYPRSRDDEDTIFASVCQSERSSATIPPQPSNQPEQVSVESTQSVDTEDARSSSVTTIDTTETYYPIDDTISNSPSSIASHSVDTGSGSSGSCD